jgi:hypothetical protein
LFINFWLFGVLLRSDNIRKVLSTMTRGTTHEGEPEQALMSSLQLHPTPFLTTRCRASKVALTVPNWYHNPQGRVDLSVAEWEKLSPEERSKFVRVTTSSSLGSLVDAYSTDVNPYRWDAAHQSSVVGKVLTFLISRVSEEMPLMIVFENAHFLDARSWEIISTLVL